ncbi:LPXTG cell wall anchor domain-containing protein [Lactobacillus crispatus]|nr:LPXTG cell wall anchor domain-containing protein [Lactobacillus crispatus]MCZ3591975.1 LPXTG cell wall anchor domain-containing protein [Lactobacillus crispatus]MCZ3600572.1 LPXTG cell wall anchor domain-containing protein [Lactobacillus crispatus]
MGQKSFNGSDDGKVYPEKNNISEEDINQLKLNDDSHLLQWGIYFNYGNQLNNPPLSLYNAIFKVAFSQDQTLIPSSIKVFEIPSGMSVDQNALRHGIKDFYDGADKSDENYYSIIATGNNEKTKFADFLRAHLVKNATGQATGFSVNQTGQKFNPNDPSYDYSTHAYFIQLDTVLSNKSGQPTSSTGMTSDTSKNTLAGQGLSADYKNKDDQSANTPIQFSRLEEALALFKNKHYKIEKVSGANATLKTDSSIGFGNFYNNENVDQHFIIYLVHETQIEKQTATVGEEVKGYYVNGPKSQNFSGINNPDVAVPKNDETPTPNVVKEVIYSRSRVVDLVKDPQGTETNWSQWISNNQAFSAIPYNNTTIKDIIDGHYHLDKNGVIHIASSQNKLTATSNSITEISAIAPNSEFLASIASTTVNGQKTTTGNLATISIWVPYSYSASKPEPTPTPIPIPESETPTTPEQPKQPSEPNTPYESEPPKSNEYKQTKIHKKVNWNSSSHPYGTDMQRQKQHKDGIIPPHGTAINNIPNSTTKTRTTNNIVKSYNNISSKLPQTSQNNSNLSLIGLALAALGLLGFTITKRKHD